jgi:hypothetical protein
MGRSSGLGFDQLRRTSSKSTIPTTRTASQSNRCSMPPRRPRPAPCASARIWSPSIRPTVTLNCPVSTTVTGGKRGLRAHGYGYRHHRFDIPPGWRPPPLSV